MSPLKARLRHVLIAVIVHPVNMVKVNVAAKDAYQILSARYQV